jgi:hypothetical protein
VPYFPYTEAQLRGRIGQAWHDEAKLLEDANLAARRLVHKTPIWSKIKRVYNELQFGKCAYCELELGGSATQHLEHYRPKANVKPWPKKAVQGIDFPIQAGCATGYYWLTYHPCNYAVACAHCNSSLKGNYFPISGAPGGDLHPIGDLNRDELPLVLQPFGDWGDNPADYIEYRGIDAKPKDGLPEQDRRRALVTIAFFNLNGERHLRDMRRRVICTVWRCVENRETAKTPAEREKYDRDLAIHLQTRAPQALCARSFVKLMKSDPGAASGFFADAHDYLLSNNDPLA